MRTGRKYQWRDSDKQATCEVAFDRPHLLLYVDICTSIVHIEIWTWPYGFVIAK